MQMKRLKCLWPGRVSPVAVIALALTALALITTPLASARFAARNANITSTAQVAQFSAPVVTNNNIGDRVMHYFHYGNRYWQPFFFIRFFNVSDVAARYRVDFRSINFHWDDEAGRINGTRTNLFPENTDLSAWTPVSNSHPQFHVQAFAFQEPALPLNTPPSNEHKAYGPTGSLLHAPNLTNNNFFANPGFPYACPYSSLRSGYDGVALRVYFTSQRTAGLANDTYGNFSRNAAFRINYDLVATQVD